MSWDAEPSEWRKALEAYPAMIKGHETSSTGKKGLADLDHFLWDELKGAVDGRNVQFLTKDEYERVISWKLKRGKWRPRLQKFASELEADVIKEQSEKAFASLRNNEIKAAISHLAKLRGCGPATASAVLAACDDSVPFMSDELILSVPCFNGKKDYTIPVYMTLVDEVRQKVKDLGEEWTVRDLERAAFANAVSTNLSLPLESVVANNGSGKEDALNAENPETGQPHSEEPQKSDEPPTEDKKTEKSTSKDAKIAEGTTQALMTEKPKPNEAKGAEEKTETVGREDTAAVGTSFANGNGNVEDDQDTGRGKAKRTTKRKAGPAKRDSKSGSSQATRKSARVQRK